MSLFSKIVKATVGFLNADGSQPFVVRHCPIDNLEPIELRTDPTMLMCSNGHRFKKDFDPSIPPLPPKQHYTGEI